MPLFRVRAEGDRICDLEIDFDVSVVGVADIWLDQSSDSKQQHLKHLRGGWRLRDRSARAATASVLFRGCIETYRHALPLQIRACRNGLSAYLEYSITPSSNRASSCAVQSSELLGSAAGACPAKADPLGPCSSMASWSMLLNGRSGDASAEPAPSQEPQGQTLLLGICIAILHMIAVLAGGSQGATCRKRLPAHKSI